VNRRASLPGASELFRPTGLARPTPQEPDEVAPERGGSGRQKHDTKITVYVSDEELLALERARLELRAAHGLVADRGRVVREAVAVLLADFESRGADSLLVRGLRQENQR
jgi:hypothetical protein